MNKILATLVTVSQKSRATEQEARNNLLKMSPLCGS